MSAAPVNDTPPSDMTVPALVREFASLKVVTNSTNSLPWWQASHGWQAYHARLDAVVTELRVRDILD